MPPKKGQGDPPQEVASSAEARTVTVAVRGGLVAKAFTDPTVELRVPDEEGTSTVQSPSLFSDEVRWFDDYWEGAGEELRVVAKGDGLEAVKVRSSDVHVVQGMVAWRTAAVPTVGSSVEGEQQVRIDANVPDGFSYERCEVKASGSTTLVVESARGRVEYVRKHHPHTVATFRRILWSRTFTPLTDQAARVLARPFELLLHDQLPEASRPNTAGDEKGKGKKGKGAEPQGKVEEVPPVGRLEFSLGALFTGQLRWELRVGVGCSTLDPVKARPAITNVPYLIVEAAVVGGDGMPVPLLTAPQLHRLLPMTYSVLTVTDIPDISPIAIAKSEAGRPFLDALASATPDYTAQAEKCSGVYTTCTLLPGCRAVTTAPTPHRRHLGVHHKEVLFLGDVASLTSGSIPNTLELIKYLFTARLTVELHDRDLKKVQGPSPHGVGTFTLAPILYTPSATPSMKYVIPIYPHRQNTVSDGEENEQPYSMPPGHYVAWNTTVSLKVELATPLPSLSFFAFSCFTRSAHAACAGALIACAKSVVVSSDDTEETEAPLVPSVSFRRGKKTTRPPVPRLSRLVVVMDYTAADASKAINALMTCLLQFPAATPDDDVALFAPMAEDPHDEEEVETSKGKKKAPPPVAEKPTPPPPRLPADDTILHVKAGAGVSGFEVIDGVHRIVLVEGLTTPTLLALLDTIHEAISTEGLQSGAVRVIFNSDITFPLRSYIAWPHIVCVDIGTDTENDTDPGGVGGRIRRIRLSRSLKEISGILRNYIRRHQSESMLRAVSSLMQLTTVSRMTEAIEHSLFPSAANLVDLEKVYGSTLSPFDVCGYHEFRPFGKVAAGRSEAPLSSSTPTDPDSDFESHVLRKNRAVEELRGIIRHEQHPTSLDELRQLVGKSVTLVGRPTGPANGRREGRQGKWMYVPQVQGKLFLILSDDTTRPPKSAIQVEGTVVLCDDGTLGLEVERWVPKKEGGGAISVVNNSFISKKKRDERRLGHEHYRGIVQRQNAYSLKAKGAYSATQDDSESDDEDYDYTLAKGEAGAFHRPADSIATPPPWPSVTKDFVFSNTTGLTTKKRPRLVPHEPPPSEAPKGDREIPRAGFAQLSGGWERLREGEHGVLVRLNDKYRDGRIGRVLREGVQPGTVVVAFRGREEEHPVSRLERHTKTALLDNRHPKQPSPDRMDELSTPWQEQHARDGDGGSAKKVGREKRFVTTGKSGVFFASSASLIRSEEYVDKSGVEEREKLPSVTPHTLRTRNAPCQLDRSKGILAGPANRVALRKHPVEEPPLSIHTPSANNTTKREVSTFYYPPARSPGRQPVRPVTDTERVGPIWGR